MNRWRFSVRGMLLFTALVAVVLSVAVNMPFLFLLGLIVGAIALALLAISQSLEHATSERRPLLAAIAWLLIGTFFGGLALFVWWNVQSFGGESVRTGEFVFLIMMGGCVLLCLFRACRAMLSVGAKQSADHTPPPSSDAR